MIYFTLIGLNYIYFISFFQQMEQRPTIQRRQRKVSTTQEEVSRFGASQLMCGRPGPLGSGGGRAAQSGETASCGCDGVRCVVVVFSQMDRLGGT